MPDNDPPIQATGAPDKTPRPFVAGDDERRGCVIVLFVALPLLITIYAVAMIAAFKLGWWLLSQ